MLLEVRNLNVWYGEVQILRNLDFSFEERELISVVGSNGAGKSTLLKAIAGLIRTKKGVLNFRSQNISRMRSSELVELGIVLVPEGRDLFPQMTVLENIELGSCCKRAAGQRQKNIKKVFDLMPGLWDRKKQLAGTLSGGEQQMVAIARGLMGAPVVLLLDEPSLGLAPLFVQNLLDLISTLHNEERMGIVLVEQNIKHALSISDRAYVIENGTVAFTGNSREVLQDDRTRRAYLGR